MILFPNAKINLGLQILERRIDGYHNLETVFIPIGLSDILEFVKSKGNNTTITLSGLKFDGNQDENIVFRAWQLMHKKFKISPVNIYLHKVIPVSAGLGGGSADAAFMLTGLNDYFKCGASIADLEDIASQLGSDCSFFIRNKAAIGTGRGELLERIDLSLVGYRILIVNPGIFISTREAYAKAIPFKNDDSLKYLISRPVSDWQRLVINDFEKSVFNIHPEIEKIKNELIKAGSVYAAMSGSGSTVYGIFDQNFNLDLVAARFGQYFTWQGPANNIV
jgi:4-diphosphocytidyl-2-C-methyl-D-erythritol kinase